MITKYDIQAFDIQKTEILRGAIQRGEPGENFNRKCSGCGHLPTECIDGCPELYYWADFLRAEGVEPDQFTGSDLQRCKQAQAILTQAKLRGQK